MEKKILPYGYWNSNRIAIAVVAVANYVDGELFDWAAYIGGSTRVEQAEDTYEEVAKHGVKLLRDHAVCFTQGTLSPNRYRE